ncbi:MAG: TonB-dependent receptor [Nitrospira sp.]|nr:TonB-dependent receptor [Nitrospira sp.]
MRWREVGIGIGIFALLTTMAMASARSAFAQTEMVTVNIPPQELSSALTALAEQTQLQLLYASELASGRTTAGVTGTMTPQEATRQLLEGTGLQFTFTDAKTVTLQSALPAGAAVGGAAIVAEGAKSKPIKVPEILVKDVRQRNNDTTSYVAEEASTATRTDTPIIQVPQSVGVVTQRVIEDQRAVRLQQALRNVSGVQFGQSDSGELATDVAFCRGFPCSYFKNYLRNENGEQASTFRDIANIQRLEVLKGPASVLYGRGEPGGIINILTKQPQAERYHSIQQIVGSYNYYRTMIDSTGPLDKDGKFLYRINGAYENRESFRDFVNGQRYFIAPVFTWLAGSNTTITVESEYLHHRQTFDNGFPAIWADVAPLPRSRFLGEPFNLSHTEEGRVSLTVAHRFSDSWRVESRFRADETTVLGRVAFSDTVLPDNRTLTRNFFLLRPDSSSYYWRNDLIGKVSTGFLQHKLLTGVEIGRQSTSLDFAFAPFPSIDIFNPLYNQAPVPDVTLTLASRVFANSVAGYIQDEIALFDKLHVLFGARGDYFHQNTNVSNVVTKTEDFAFSPRIGVSYQPIPQVALYSNVTRSFQPVFNPFTAASNIFKPTTATQYEAGIKTDIVPGRLTSTLAIYRILKEDALALDPNNPFFFVQTGAQRSQGVEFDMTAQLMPGWRVIATYAYTDARVTADTTIPVGNRLPLIARHTGSLWSTYDFQEGLFTGFGVGGGLFAVGERAGDINNSFELPGYVRTDAALYYRKQEIFSRTNLIAQLNFINLLNQEYFYGGFGNRSVAGLPGAPLSVFGSVKLEFF